LGASPPPEDEDEPDTESGFAALEASALGAAPPEESPLEADEPRDAAESRGADDFLLSFL
jgi:hypothetical protein